MQLLQLCNVVIIDSNLEKIQITKKIAKQENRNNMHFVVADISDKIFEHNQFDLIIFNNILEWSASFSNVNPTTLLNDVLNEVYNLLKPEGILYFGTENKYGLKYLLGEKHDISKYNEKLKRIYEIFSGEELTNLYPAYSIISKK